MSTRRRVVTATPEKVWEVLADGWLYPLFVVGATRMRTVDRSWPSHGAQLHHSVGVWPLTLNDTSEVLEARAPTYLKLRVRGWPAGEAEVQFHLEPHANGTEVSITEDAVSGPGKLMPKPLRDVELAVRNDETLKRLAFVAENRGVAESS